MLKSASLSQTRCSCSMSLQRTCEFIRGKHHRSSGSRVKSQILENASRPPRCGNTPLREFFMIGDEQRAARRCSPKVSKSEVLCVLWSSCQTNADRIDIAWELRGRAGETRIGFNLLWCHFCCHFFWVGLKVVARDILQWCRS